MAAVMPSLRGLLLDEAHTVLADIGASVVVEPEFAADVPLRLRVIAQKPEPGTGLTSMTEIRLIVSPEDD